MIDFTQRKIKATIRIINVGKIYKKKVDIQELQ